MPMTIALPVCGKTPFISSAAPALPLSILVIARAMDRGSPAKSFSVNSFVDISKFQAAIFSFFDSKTKKGEPQVTHLFHFSPFTLFPFYICPSSADGP